MYNPFEINCNIFLASQTPHGGHKMHAMILKICPVDLAKAIKIEMSFDDETFLCFFKNPQPNRRIAKGDVTIMEPCASQILIHPHIHTDVYHVQKAGLDSGVVRYLFTC